jgi:hypothetical protein
MNLLAGRRHKINIHAIIEPIIPPIRELIFTIFRIFFTIFLLRSIFKDNCSIFCILQKLLKILFFNKIIYKNKKPFSKRPKGWEWSGSPYWTRSELLRGI